MASTTAYNQISRMLMIDELIAYDNINDYSISDIHKRVSSQWKCSERTIRNDIDFMKICLDAPIESTNGIYSYTRPFSIRKLPYDASQFEDTRNMLGSLVRFVIMNNDEDVSKLYVKLYQSFGFRSGPGSVIDFGDVSCGSWEAVYFEKLINKIVSRQVVSFYYKPFHLEGRRRKVSPYFLKQYNGRWFLLGASDCGELQIFGLERIDFDSMRDEDAAYIEADIDFGEYFDNLVGVTRPLNRDIEQVVLKVDEREYPYLESKELDSSQDEILNYEGAEPGYVYVSLNVVVNYELRRALLAYGDKVTVMEPRSLRNKMKSDIRKMLANY